MILVQCLEIYLKNILNLGQGDTGPLLMYARFREYLKRMYQTCYGFIMRETIIMISIEN